MTAYATVAHMVLAATGGWAGLAQRALPTGQVSGELLQLTAEGGDRSAYDLEQITEADAAFDRLQDVLDRASRHADTYLFPRYRPVMPLSAELVAGSDLPTVVATIAYKRLYGTEVPEDVRKGSQWADDYLKSLATGLVSLGAQDTEVAQPAGHVVTRTPAKTFAWDAY